MAGAIYVHIPFCVRKCAYCDFPSVAHDPALAEGYVEALGREMALRAASTTGGAADTVYIGGGTPTVLSEGLLARVFASLRENFALSPGAEVTVEANPGTLNRGKADFLLGLGANRVSLGAQSFEDRELAVLGRSHTAGEAEAAARLLEGTNFSLDLIYGVPGQDPGSWRRSLERAVGLSPAHVSAYELTPEEGTPLLAALREGRLRLPPEEEVVEMFAMAEEALSGAGLRRYEISNYALPGRQCRHNVNYWRRGPYTGLGAGAHSFDGRTRRANGPDIRGYIEALSEGRLPPAVSQETTWEDALKETVFLGLRMTEGVELQGPAAGAVMEASGGLIEEGLMEKAGGRLRLTRRGLLVSNSVFALLFEAIEKRAWPAGGSIAKG
ncbi:MAG: radical SAM family heme chaperone HemW [Thermodesulfovibrionales bacterium]